MASPRNVPKSQLAAVTLCAFDVEGVLTDNTKLYGDDGLCMLPFSARDGLGIYLLQRTAVSVAIITNCTSPIISRRAGDLDISLVLTGVEDKGLALRRLSHDLSVATSKVLYMGDDLWDLSAFAQAGIRVTVPEAPERVRCAADWITEERGGNGAVREVADAILDAKGVDPLNLLPSHANRKSHDDPHEQHDESSTV